jgi:hypothetical protein
MFEDLRATTKVSITLTKAENTFKGFVIEDEPTPEPEKVQEVVKEDVKEVSNKTDNQTSNATEEIVIPED